MNVLVTGVSRYVGAHLAARLAVHPRVTRVSGVDNQPPAGELAKLLAERDVDVITGDLRGVIGAVAGGEVEAVAHMGVISSPGRAGRFPRQRSSAAGAGLPARGRAQRAAPCVQDAGGQTRTSIRSARLRIGSESAGRRSRGGDRR